MLVKSHMYFRCQLGDYLNDLGLVGTAVEVGTHRGEFARTFLGRWDGEKLLCIDPWINLPDFVEQAQYLVGGGDDRREDYRICRMHLQCFKERVRYLQMTSFEALERVENGSLDFVYLDGNHEPPHVMSDIIGWYRKLKPGGVLAGHDFLCPGEADHPENWGRYIQPAVLRFFEGHTIYLIVEADNLPWTYCVRKPFSMDSSTISI